MTAHPEVIKAINKIVAACGQLSAAVQKPFLTVCDAAMGYHLPACLRFLEETHLPEMLRESGSRGLSSAEIAQKISQDMHLAGDTKILDPNKLSHILRLLATHHITREVRPDVFANNRVSSVMDTGKPWAELAAMKDAPECKYEGTDGIAAFVGLCTDELFKASAYLTDCYLPKKGLQPGDEMYAPFNVAFGTGMRYFEWLEKRENAFRLRRFGKAMTGTEKWEVPGSIIGGFPWHELVPGSVVVDVGGGIGSTSMLLANAFPHLKFVIQDRPPVVEMGTAAWRSRYPDLLDTGRAVFMAHDFFKPQPPLPADMIVKPAVFLMRVITHDWPDSYVTRILLRLRQAAGPKTRLLLADYVLPLACVDEDEDKITRDSLPGTLRTLAPEGSPLLSNLGKASANAYWLDLTMRAMFNAQERTLRELSALARSAGWKIVQVTR
ncbi:hypothetical protein PHLGIDRAFT_94938, partial [Phlebiopsis gigantea 11061_1 CR5-6]